jgi:hypothetical protein
MGVGVKRHAPAALPSGKRPGNHCAGGCVDPSVGLDRFEESSPHRDSIRVLVHPVSSRNYITAAYNILSLLK